MQEIKHTTTTTPLDNYSCHTQKWKQLIGNSEEQTKVPIHFSVLSKCKPSIPLPITLNKGKRYNFNLSYFISALTRVH